MTLLELEDLRHRELLTEAPGETRHNHKFEGLVNDGTVVTFGNSCVVMYLYSGRGSVCYLDHLRSLVF